MIALLLLVQLESSLGTLPLPAIVGMSGESRTYHPVPLARLVDTKWTHVAVCGKVTLVKHEADGDVHIRMDVGPRFVVAEIVDYKPLPPPKVGQTIVVKGVSRFDKTHGWAEVHPVEALTQVNACQKESTSARSKR